MRKCPVVTRWGQLWNTQCVESGMEKLDREHDSVCNRDSPTVRFFLWVSTFYLSNFMYNGAGKIQDLRILTSLLTGHNRLNRQVTLLRKKSGKELDTSIYYLGLCAATMDRWKNYIGFPLLRPRELKTRILVYSLAVCEIFQEVSVTFKLSRG